MAIFLGLVFLAVFLLTQGTVVPVFGEAARTRKRLQARLQGLTQGQVQSEVASLIRSKYMRRLSPGEQWLESLPGMAEIARLIEQSGSEIPAYRVVGTAVALGLLGLFAGWGLTRLWYVSAVLGAGASFVPFMRLIMLRGKLILRFEEQFPEALDVIKRSLKAGHPFTQSLKLVADDMDPPISREFETVFMEINYGNDVRQALLGLLQRIPTVSVTALVTAVLVQRETGGNLAETLERITAVIRGRFKLARRVKTLSAEGRLSAWILALVPLLLFAVIWVTTPDYLPTLIKHPKGPMLISLAVGMGIVGIFWIRRIIQIQV